MNEIAKETRDFLFPNILEFKDGQEALQWFKDTFPDGEEYLDYAKKSYQEIYEKISEKYPLPPGCEKIVPRAFGGGYDWVGNPLCSWEVSALLMFNRHIGDDYIDGYRVSTVWLGHNLGWHEEILIFETMVFCDKEDDEWNHYQDRYSKLEYAQHGHKFVCESIKRRDSIDDNL